MARLCWVSSLDRATNTTKTTLDPKGTATIEEFGYLTKCTTDTFTPCSFRYLIYGESMISNVDIKDYADAFYKQPTVDDILNERGSRYGTFTTHADITQHLKDYFKTFRNWNVMQPDQKEALDMVAHKIGRILNGDPNYADSWVDIAGYAKLVADRLEGKVR